MAIYDETCHEYVVVDKIILLKTDNILEGILFFCLSHYMYGHNYTENKSSSLEFIHRYVNFISISKIVLNGK